MTFWYDHTNNNNSSSRPFVYPNSPFNQSNWISEHLSAFQPPTLSSPPPYMYMPTYYYAGEGLMEPPQQFQLNRPMYFKENGDPQPKKTEMDSKFEGNNNNHDEVPKLNMMRWGKPNGEQLQSYPTPNNAPYRPLSIKNRLRTSVTIPITFVNHPRKIEKNEIERPALRCIKNILGDGNCMFRAIATELSRLMNSDAGFDYEVRLQLGLENPRDQSMFIHTLRHKVVTEWLELSRLYQGFVENQYDFQTEAMRFLDDGYYASEMGDLVPAAIANIFSIKIKIFVMEQGTINSTNVVEVEPSKSIKLDKWRTIYLAYNPSGGGHYNVAVPEVY